MEKQDLLSVLDEIAVLSTACPAEISGVRHLAGVHETRAYKFLKVVKILDDSELAVAIYFSPHLAIGNSETDFNLGVTEYDLFLKRLRFLEYPYDLEFFREALQRKSNVLNIQDAMKYLFPWDKERLVRDVEAAIQNTDKEMLRDIV